MRNALPRKGVSMRVSPFLWLIASLSITDTCLAEVTFTRDVQPILARRCQMCHRPGEAAPMTFTTYQETRPWAQAIREAVLTGKMPPWFANPAYGTFSNDRSMPKEEAAVLAEWATTGAKEGDPKTAAGPPQFVEGWNIGQPDVIYEMPVDFQVPATGVVPYMFFVVPTGFKEDRWVEKIEVRPGNRSVVHHAVVQVRALGTQYLMDARPGIPLPDVPVEPKTGEDKGVGEFGFPLGKGVEVAAVYVPGSVGDSGKPGHARLVKAGSDLIFEIHYTPNGKPAADRTRVGITFSRQPPVQRVLNALVANERLRIPAGASNHEVRAKVELHRDVSVISLFPHMHLRGRSFRFLARYPDGKSEVLLDVPGYTFNWQLTYTLKDPKWLPKGSVLECVAHYDNSANNPFNPDPSKEVRWGNQTWEEMLIGFVDFAIPADADPAEIEAASK